MKIIFGLGNYGSKYDGTRHNIGVEVVRAFAERHGMEWKVHRFKGYDSAEGSIAGEPVICVLSRGFMNTSGDILRKLHANADDLIVVHDELAIPIGLLKLSERGGTAGHNGVASVTEQFGTQEFIRLRLGISPEGTRIPVPTGEKRASFVLGKFSPEEREKIALLVPHAVEALEVLLKYGIARAMNRFNG